MMHSIPTEIDRAARQVVLRAPNSMECVVFRKKLLRTAEDLVGGLPMIAGIGLLDSEDEAEYEYEELGEGRVLFAGNYAAAASNINDSDDGVIYGEGTMLLRVESKVEGAFEVKKHDMLQVMPGNGFVMPYEVVGRTSPTSIPPYVRQWIVEPRQDDQVGI